MRIKGVPRARGVRVPPLQQRLSLSLPRPRVKRGRGSLPVGATCSPTKAGKVPKRALNESPLSLPRGARAPLQSEERTPLNPPLAQSRFVAFYPPAAGVCGGSGEKRFVNLEAGPIGENYVRACVARIE